MNEVYPFCIADTDKWRHNVTIQLIIIYWKSGDNLLDTQLLFTLYNLAGHFKKC